MRFGSVCSGIEAASVAWESLGWKAQWCSDIEPFPNAVLAHRFPTVPNLGDMTRIHERAEFRDNPIDLLVGGTPCQSFSVAGLRKGMADPRGNLALVFLRIASIARPRWIVWENVPGVLSSGGGRDFGAFLGALAQLGYSWSYRVLDAQHFGVPQRRRRVFVVGHLGDWRYPAAVLFERESLRGNPTKGRKKGKDPACAAPLGAKGGSGYRQDLDNETYVTHSLQARHDGSEDGSGRGVPLVPTVMRMREGKPGGGKGPLLASDSELSLAAGNDQVLFAPQIFDMRGNGDGEVSHTLSRSAAGDRPNDFAPMVFTQNQAGDVLASEGSPSLGTNSNASGRNMPKLHQGMAVRRLTPRECERLQGFPDDWTLVPYRGKPAADGPRYKAIGNSMAVPVMAWLGARIQAVEHNPHSIQPEEKP